MSTPPWIRSTGESDPVVARLKARAGDPRPDSVHHGSTDPDPGLETGTGEASESPPQVPIEEPSASPTSLSDVPRELEVHPRPGADIAATLRGRVRGEKRDEGEEELPPPAHFPQSTLAILKTGSAMFGLVACIVGGFALGLISNWGQILLGNAQWADVVAFVVLVLVLIVRPSGLLGQSLGRSKA